MKITAIELQARDKNRVNVSVDGKYRFSLDVFQVGELGLKLGKEYDEAELTELETESQFGKLYARSLEYCLMRPHSGKEIRDYLWRKMRDTRTKTGEVRKGVSEELTTRVFERLLQKGYINDDAFARYWAENRSQAKGASRRKLTDELRAKGIDQTTIDAALASSSRSDEDELMKVIAKKRARYPDEQKFIAYLARQGFSYDDIKSALSVQFDSDESA